MVRKATITLVHKQEATMKRNDIRIMKMDRNNRSILMRALYADFCANRKTGRPNEHYAALIIKVHNTPAGQTSAERCRVPPGPQLAQQPAQCTNRCGRIHRCGRCSPDQAGEGKAAVLAVLVNGSPKSVQQQPGCNVRAVVGSGGLLSSFPLKVCWLW